MDMLLLSHTSLPGTVQLTPAAIMIFVEHTGPIFTAHTVERVLVLAFLKQFYAWVAAIMTADAIIEVDVLNALV